MTTIQPATVASAAVESHLTSETRLRQALAVDGASSALAAIVTLALAGPISDRMDVPTGAVLAIGVGVAVWAVDVGLLSRADRSTVTRWTPYVIALNALWVVATAAVLLGGLVAGSSWWFLVLLAIAVGDFGLAQWWFYRRMR